MRFSERIGKRVPRLELQVDDMDEPLRNSLWTIVMEHVFVHQGDHRWTSLHSQAVISFTKRIFVNFLKWPSDRVPQTPFQCQEVLRKWFFEASSFEVYDFIEACVEHIGNERYLAKPKEFSHHANIFLARELSAYRFVGSHLAPITSSQEVQAVNDASDAAGKFKAVGSHIQTAILLFGRRENADYRNAIKEAISAVEAATRIISENDKATLGDALKKLEKSHDIHPALRDGLLKLYGYTNDEGGIRHSMVDFDNVDLVDAYFMIVSCSAFCNYLIARCG